MDTNIRKNLSFALTSGLLLGIPWIIPPFFFLIFIAWVPLFQLEEDICHNQNRYALFNYAFAGFLLWNILGYWWISQAQWLGAILIILANSLLQALVFWSASRVRTILRIPLFFPFLLIWMGYEHFHNTWDLAWPWLNLGNSLVTALKLIQWYEFTGVRGGSLWIILTNFAVFKAYEIYQKRGLGSMAPVGAGILLLLLVPSFVSYQIYRNFREEGETVKIALIQPNLDPYTEKFVPEKQAQHLEEFFRTAETICDDETLYLFGPETLIVQQIDEKNPSASPYYRQLMDFQQKHPRLNLLLGVHSYQKLGNDIPPGSRFDREKGFYYEAFNTALFLAPGSAPQFYHKTKLVTQKKGFICMITNDGWWKNTPGYRHHYNFSPVRAIECRRDLVRVANTGISALIDARGMVIAQTPWWEKATLTGKVHLRQGRTFFARHGDYLGRISLALGILLIIYGVIRNLINKKKNESR
jgi:apolipoprotein N-acyltransferase